MGQEPQQMGHGMTTMVAAGASMRIRIVARRGEGGMIVGTGGVPRSGGERIER